MSTETAPTAGKRVYVAGPYTRPDPCANTHQAILTADLLWDLGFVPFVPHLTHFWHTMSPKPYQAWLDYDNNWLLCCDAVLRIPGESSGADKETALAVASGIPVFHSIADLIVWRDRKAA